MLKNVLRICLDKQDVDPFMVHNKSYTIIKQKSPKLKLKLQKILTSFELKLLTIVK